jgi:hypothetical protein
MASHIAFEFKRFNYAAGHELFETLGTGELIRESFLIHFRNLLDFLYRTTKSNAKDALAIDYAPQWRPEVPTWLEAER